jgi:CheY-like chemotaxis protein
VDIEAILEDLGHHVVGVASAQGQAVALAAERQPQLIMADIQLETEARESRRSTRFSPPPTSR